MRLLIRIFLLTTAAIAPIAAQSRVDVKLVTDEADAALDILHTRRLGQHIRDEQWTRLFASEGYGRLAQRELSMRRPFSDSAFREFLLSDTLLAREPSLASAMDRYRALPVTAAANRALAYLPAGASLRAVIFPEIKPRTNTFVFTADSVPGLFMYVEPTRSPQEEENTLAHELHHLGFASVCTLAPDSSLRPAVDMLRMRLFGFGEGLAMLAAAGGASIHPHAVSNAETRARWDRDVANVAADMRTMERWMTDVLDRRVTSPDSVVATAMTFYGTQGPWYTVGWYMASTIERAAGRQRLIDVMCDPVTLMSAYNAVASDSQPKWSGSIITRLPVSRRK